MKKIYLTLIPLLLCMFLTVAQAEPTIDEKLTKTDNIYALTANVSNSSVTVSDLANATLDGANFVCNNTPLVLTNCCNITVINWAWTNTTGPALILVGGTNITVTNCSLSNNQQGIMLTNHIDGQLITLNVTIYRNNFYNNVDIVADLIFDSATQISFSNGTCGNFWYPYAGADADLNGVGDTPYQPTEAFSDPTPLMSPVGEPPIVVPEYTTYLLLVVAVGLIISYVLRRKTSHSHSA